ncbi:MAG: hypothetical protein GY899_05450 [Verrucomicrobiaceae bacterium]|nr:hypothetical protein [Verrucomicrobiaceae bacterium]
MAEGKRPGGLTALAVLNFVFGGLGAIGALGMLALFGAANAATDGAAGELMSEGMSEAGLSGGMLMVTMVLAVVSSILLIISGVGYIKLKRGLGRNMGSLYGILALVGTAIGIVGGQPFGLSSIIGLIYPLLTLILVNTTFKEDLVN